MDLEDSPKRFDIKMLNEGEKREVPRDLKKEIKPLDKDDPLVQMLIRSASWLKIISPMVTPRLLKP